MGRFSAAMISMLICVKETSRQSDLVNREMEFQLNGLMPRRQRKIAVFQQKQGEAMLDAVKSIKEKMVLACNVLQRQAC
jgi:hypothetical protein